MVCVLGAVDTLDLAAEEEAEADVEDSVDEEDAAVVVPAPFLGFVAKLAAGQPHLDRSNRLTGRPTANLLTKPCACRLAEHSMINDCHR